MKPGPGFALFWAIIVLLRGICLCVFGTTGGDKRRLYWTGRAGDHRAHRSVRRSDRPRASNHPDIEPRTHGRAVRSEKAEGESRRHQTHERGPLRGGEVVPNFAGGLDLEDATLVRMEEVISIRNPVVSSRAHGATRPVSWTNSAAMLFDLGYEVDSILDPILDPGGPGGY
jgi:hypothetical protein